MLEAMSKILVFSIEEKESLGMVKKEVLQGTGEAEQSLINKKGFSDQLVNFLMDSDDDE
jgi:hypothetical protein